MNTEKWTKVNGYPLYSVSNRGRVRNDSSGRVLSPGKTVGGYLFVGLGNKEGRRTRFLHRLVAEAFLANPESKREVNHKDGNKLNNDVSNLEWCTRSENLTHSYKTLGRKPAICEEAKAALKKANENRAVPVLCVETGVVYKSIKEAARAVGGNSANIWKCFVGKQKTTKGFHWRIAEGAEPVREGSETMQGF